MILFTVSARDGEIGVVTRFESLGAVSAVSKVARLVIVPPLGAAGVVAKTEPR